MAETALNQFSVQSGANLNIPGKFQRERRVLLRTRKIRILVVKLDDRTMESMHPVYGNGYRDRLGGEARWTPGTYVRDVDGNKRAFCMEANARWPLQPVTGRDWVYRHPTELWDQEEEDKEKG